MITGLKYPPLKSAVNKVEQLPRVLFYKATGCKNAKCAKGAEGLYNAVDTTTGKFLGSIDVRPDNSRSVGYLLDRLRLYETLNKRELSVGGKKVKLPYAEEYENVYDVFAKEGKYLNSEEQELFSIRGIALLKNLSDKFKRPIVFERGKSAVPNSMRLSAIRSRNFVAIPRDAGLYKKSRRAIDGEEMEKRCYYLTYGNGGYNEQTYKKVDKYLENNNIYSLVYAEYAVHPKVKRPNLITAVKEFFLDTKRIFNEIIRVININSTKNKEVKITVE